MKTDFAEHGFKIIPSVFSPREISGLREEADRVARSKKSACVRNICSLSEIFESLLRSPRLLALLPASTHIPVRSILFDKTSEENWPVAWHQDLTIATTSRQDCEGYGPWSVKDGIPHTQAPVKLLEKIATLRIHLDETDETNGALIVSPASHLHGRLTPEAISELVSGSSTTCECRPGDVLLMSPLLLHSSKRSLNPSRRRILHFEYAPQDALDPRLSWHETNQESSLPAHSQLNFFH